MNGVTNFQVDAFTDSQFKKPAAVVILEKHLG